MSIASAEIAKSSVSESHVAGRRVPALQAGDRELLDHLRKVKSASISELCEWLGVTPPAVRQRLTRLLAEGLIDRRLERGGDGRTNSNRRRGRPSHRYWLTKKGERVAGDNYQDLATILWDEIRQVDDPHIRMGLLKRLAKRLAEAYAGDVKSGDLATRMQELTRLMAEREVPFVVDDSGDLPIITALACPYPDLAEHDRSVCAMERMMVSEVLGKTVKLSECRLDGGECCSFSPSRLSDRTAE